MVLILVLKELNKNKQEEGACKKQNILYPNSFYFFYFILEVENQKAKVLGSSLAGPVVRTRGFQQWH